MIRLSLATASLLGLVAFAAPARADDVHIDFGVGFRDGRAPSGFFGIGVGTSAHAPRPRVHVEPVPYVPVRPANPGRQFVPEGSAPFGAPAFGAHDGDGGRHRGGFEPAREFIPAHLEVRSVTVCEPAVYEDRLVPVFEDRCVPIYDVVCIPLFENHVVPVYKRVVDPRSGRSHKVVVGQRTEQVKVGERKERVKIGERHEQVEVGTRMERVLVRAEVTRVVNHEEWVPGRYVTAGAGARDRLERRGRGEFPRGEFGRTRHDEFEVVPAPYIARR